MLVEAVVGAVLGLVVLAGIVALVLKRAPGALVADKLPENLHSGADEVDELVTGSAKSGRNVLDEDALLDDE